MDSIGEGGYAIIAFRFRVWTGDGELELRATCDVYDEDDSFVDSRERTGEEIVQPDEYSTFEWAFVFDSRQWGQQEYTAEVLVRDDITGQTSAAATTTFEIVSALSGDEASYVRYIGPDPIQAGESFTYEVEVRNETGRDSTVVSAIEERLNVDEWYELNSRVNLNIPSGTERRFEKEWMIDTVGNYEWRLSSVNVDWNATVEE